MTRIELERRLCEGGIPDAAWEARLLFCHVTGISAAEALAFPERAGDENALAVLAARRIAREPLQYILGETGFYNEIYTVRPGVLIPRSDTELLVELAIRRLPQNAHFADFCTGSGCIAVSVLKNRPDLTAEAFDLSPDAVSLAKENAERNGVSDRITVARCNLPEANFPACRFAAILSNPPYIPSAVVPTLSPEVQREPALALDGGEDGMDFYRAFLARHRGVLQNGGFFLFEIGYDQREAILSLGNSFKMQTTVYNDIENRPRCALLC